MQGDSNADWPTCILDDSSNISKVGAKVGHKIDFTTAKAKRKSLNRVLDGEEAGMPGIRPVPSTSKLSPWFSIEQSVEFPPHI